MKNEVKRRVAIAVVLMLVVTALQGGSWKGAAIEMKKAVVQAEEVTPVSKAAISVSWEKELLEVKKKEGTISLGDVFYWQITADKSGIATKPVDGKWIAQTVESKDASTDAYEMDLSWLSVKKAQTMYVCFNPYDVNEAPTELTLPAQITKLKVSFTTTKPTEGAAGVEYVGTDSAGYLYVHSSSDARITKMNQLQWRWKNGVWRAMKDLDLSKFENKGCSFQFRVKPDENNPASKVVSYKYSAKANGPKISVDYNKGTVKVSNKLEWKLAADYSDASKEWNKVGNVKYMYFDEFGYTGNNMKIFLRTAAGKKVASRITVVTIGKEVESTKSVVVSTSSGLAQEDVADHIAINYSKSANAASGIVVCNTSDQAYQVALVNRADMGSYLVTEAGKIEFKGGASVLKIGAKDSKVKFVDIPAKTAKKDKIKKTIKTKNILSNDNLSEYCLLYRMYDKKRKNIIAPSKIYAIAVPELCQV